MAELYSSLSRLKMALRNGVLPPMTPVPSSAQALIDPAFTIGMGALREDERRGLQCPVRHCGQWRHRLTQHLNLSHRSLGGAKAVRSALSIPPTAALWSLAAKTQASAEMLRKRADGRCVTTGGKGGGRKGHKKHRQTVGARNFRNMCDAQLSHRLIDLQNKLGRPPIGAEFVLENGRPALDALLRVYGTWRNAIAQCGLDAKAHPRRHSHEIRREAVLAGLSAYYERHGALPLASSACFPSRSPLLCDYGKTLRAMGTDNWPEAMRIAASLLGVHGGRYGLPTTNPTTSARNDLKSDESRNPASPLPTTTCDASSQ